MRMPMTLAVTIALAGGLACNDSQGPGGGGGGGGGGGTPPVFLKDVDVASLPSPYYHFAYDSAGRITSVSFASAFFSYDVLYQGDRITELRNNALGNTDRLVYVYDAAGRVGTVKYVDAQDSVFARVRLIYDGDRLSRLDRERKLQGVFTLEKTLSFSYDTDGNVQEIVDHRPVLNGQPETTTVDHFEQYDGNVNVDAFGLIHNDFFDHVVLLPNVQLQKGNPARETFTTGNVNYRFDYTYTYDGQKRPLVKGGTATVLSGPDSGRVIPLHTGFSYY
ncbi:MAG TPA: hypothetical protein VFP39_12225 [Gemmatimonadales bacterium]|nr:hypothetical protein [Gemmatimonadales bacterium]